MSCSSSCGGGSATDTGRKRRTLTVSLTDATATVQPAEPDRFEIISPDNQALGRSQPAFPMMPGLPEKRTHDYVRNGTTSLFAAFNTADGTVISSLHRRHRSVEFKKFLAKIDQEVPSDLDVHLICDNYSTHKSPVVKT